MTALMAGQVSADACSLCPPDSQPHSRAAQALTGNNSCHPAGREGPGCSLVQSTMRANSPGLWDCLPSPTLLMGPSSQQSAAPGAQLLPSPIHKTLSAHPTGIRPPAGLEQLSCQVRSQTGSGRDMVEIYTLSQTGGLFCCGASPPSCHHPPGGRQRLEPRGPC